MSGCNEGVAAKLKRTYLWLIYIYCAEHRLNLIVVAYFCKVNAASPVIKAFKSLHITPSTFQVTGKYSKAYEQKFILKSR